MRNITEFWKMPPIRRRLLVGLCALAVAIVAHASPQTAIAQSADKAPATPKKAEAPPKAPPAPQAATPGAETILVLIRSTILRLNDALLTGNFTVMRDLAAPSFTQANSAGRLYQIFANLSAQGIDLSAVAILAPQLPETPAIDQKGRLRIKGHFPGQPVQINFDMQFETVDRRWRLLALSINPAPSLGSVSAIPPAKSAPGGKTGK